LVEILSLVEVCALWVLLLFLLLLVLAHCNSLPYSQFIIQSINQSINDWRLSVLGCCWCRDNAVECCWPVWLGTRVSFRLCDMHVTTSTSSRWRHKVKLCISFGTYRSCARLSAGSCTVSRYPPVTVLYTFWCNAYDTRTRNRHRKPIPKNRYHKSARKYSIVLFVGTRNIWYQIACQTCQKPVAAFWCYQFAAPISDTCVVGIICRVREEVRAELSFVTLVCVATVLMFNNV